MKILIVHNRYKQPGGEDVVVNNEARLLRDAGHEVTELVRTNEEVDRLRWYQKLLWPFWIIWSPATYRQLTGVLRRVRPDIVHFHNVYMMVSPSAYYACKRFGVPIVQSVHNPRLVCPAATLTRKGRACQACGKGLWFLPGVFWRCYRKSAFLTLAVALMVSLHRIIGTWRGCVDGYIVSTEFYRNLMRGAGLPAKKLILKPHFAFAGRGGTAQTELGQYALYIGRLDAEKGIGVVLQAWSKLQGIPLKIRGEGQVLSEVHAEIASGAEIEWVERLDSERLQALIRDARFLIWPTMGNYESFGLVAIESFAAGVPVLASRTGVMTEIVQDGLTGLHFNPGDSNDLAQKVTWAWNHPEELRAMGRRARERWQQQFAPDGNLIALTGIYQELIQGAPLDPGAG